MTASLILRVLAVMCVALGVVLVIAGAAAGKDPMDLIARAVLWPGVAFIAWVVADLRSPEA